MGLPCACTSPTGAKGEVLTFTRASSGTCLKGPTSTLIQNGDMVTCTNDRARVMPGGDGTGGNGLLIEGVRTNSAPRSEEIDNVLWTKNGVGVAAPTVTANAAVAPDGNTTAERVQFPATAAAQASQVFQAGCPLTQNAGSIFVKGNGTSGTLDFWQYGAAVVCVACPYVAESWTRCTNAPATAATNTTFVIGNDTATCGGARSAADVFIWGAQCETGTFASSYIATAGATATRAVDRPSVVLSAALSDASASHALTFVPNWTTAGGTAVQPYFLTYATTGRSIYANRDDDVRIFDGTTEITNSTTYTAGTPKRLWSSYSSNQQVNDGADTSSGVFDGTFGTGATLYMGNDSTGSLPVQGVVKRICLDNDSLRCR